MNSAHEKAVPSLDIPNSDTAFRQSTYTAPERLGKLMLYQLSYARNGRKSKSAVPVGVDPGTAPKKMGAPKWAPVSLKQNLRQSAHELVAVSQHLHVPLEPNLKRVGDVRVRYRDLGIFGADGIPFVVVKREA